LTKGDGVKEYSIGKKKGYSADNKKDERKCKDSFVARIAQDVIDDKKRENDIPQKGYHVYEVKNSLHKVVCLFFI
jgi:hypothetical protein